ncbi:MAG TPA: peptidase S10 [Thermoanaerobaculia bacterium]|nr:peptidase S10 [Thermoanaerobaculia bacterium]
MPRTTSGLLWCAAAVAAALTAAVPAAAQRPPDAPASREESPRPEGGRADVPLDSARAAAEEPSRREGAATGRGDRDRDGGRPPEEKLVTTHHKARIGGREIAYTATAGTMLLKKDDGKVRATVYMTAYTRDGVSDVGHRPITFAYNGGPGSASAWLHMGAFGPRRVVMEDEGWAPPPPYQIADNNESLLDVTDLVFIDPVSTGFSRPAPGEDPASFHGVREDVESVGDFIREYIGRFERWGSPKFLAGESYGTTRSAGLSRYLQEKLNIYLNGIVLVSSILNFGTARFDVGNDLPYPLFLPTYTATAWYHKKLPADLQAGDLQQAVAEAERFAAGEYTLALTRGNDLGDAERHQVAKKLARYTGLSEAFLENANLRPTIFEFTKELLRSERLTVGRLDSRFKGVDRQAAGERFEFDPASAAFSGPFAAVFNNYVERELGFKSELNYELLTDKVRPWNYRPYDNQYVNVAEDLRYAMAINPSLKVLVNNGYYDLATPFFATQYTFSHLGFDATYPSRVSMAFYHAGHMMYVRRADREELKANIARFIAGAANVPAAPAK